MALLLTPMPASASCCLRPVPRSTSPSCPTGEMPADGGVRAGECSAASSPPPLYLLEVTVISAQDLHRRLGRSVRAYAVAWADEAHKLRTDVDLAGVADPTWNDRFLFRVHPGFLQSETAAITVEVRAARRLGADPVLGRTRIVVSAFVRPSAAAGSRQVAALLLRRPRSLRPQGIVNVAVALLDAAGAARAMPLYGAAGSPDAFAVKDLVMRSPASLGKIGEDARPDQVGLDDGEHRQRAALAEHSGPLDPRGAAVEQMKLEQTLEKWRADLSPGRRVDGQGGWGRGRRGGSCFCGSAEWDR